MKKTLPEYSRMKYWHGIHEHLRERFHNNLLCVAVLYHQIILFIENNYNNNKLL